ncbi:hypothetical protein MOV66_06545 [Agrobacterium sp. SHOUNA12C]|nr:hypothetical protein [Agrobacterium sp. BETTINA12B]MCJ9756297.1 hypothetical protein [Agrobacterium sp. SHOUNA12C]
MVRAERLPIGAIPEEDRAASVPLDVVDNQVHAAAVRLQAAIHAKVTGVQDAIRFTASAELVLSLIQEVSPLALPAVGLVPLPAMLLVTVAIVFTFALFGGWRASKAKGSRLFHCIRNRR